MMAFGLTDSIVAWMECPNNEFEMPEEVKCWLQQWNVQEGCQGIRLGNRFGVSMLAADRSGSLCCRRRSCRAFSCLFRKQKK
jgi:hypothetical protein